MYLYIVWLDSLDIASGFRCWSSESTTGITQALDQYSATKPQFATNRFARCTWHCYAKPKLSKRKSEVNAYIE